MSYTVYVVQCEEGKYYIGCTNDLEKRLSQHNNGKSRWTSSYKHWRLIYKEIFNTKTNALKREKFLKRLKCGDVFKKIISNDAG